MNQTILTFTLLVTALTLLVTALIVRRLLWSATPISAKRLGQKRFASEWRPLLGSILQAVANFLRTANSPGIHDRKEKRKQISDTTDQQPP